MSQSLISEGFHTVCKVDDIEEDDMKEFQVDGKSIIIVRLNGHFFSLSAICTHEYSRLCEGELEDDCITCPLHFARFNIRTGMPIDPPATRPLEVFEIKVADQHVWVNLTPKGGKQ